MTRRLYDIEEIEKLQRIYGYRVERGNLDEPSALFADGTDVSYGSRYGREKCLYPGCTLCMDNCPTYGIDLSVDPPELGQPRLDCEFCARLCPTGASDMNEWVQIIEKMTAKHTPMGLQFLEKAEAEGHFRRLLPLDQFDADSPGNKQRTTHPQWIIGKGAQ